MSGKKEDATGQKKNVPDNSKSTSIDETEGEDEKGLKKEEQQETEGHTGVIKKVIDGVTKHVENLIQGGVEFLEEIQNQVVWWLWIKIIHR